MHMIMSSVVRVYVRVKCTCMCMRVHVYVSASVMNVNLECISEVFLAGTCDLLQRVLAVPFAYLPEHVHVCRGLELAQQCT